MGDELNTLARRLERLERSCRYWRAAASLALAAFGLVILIGAKSGNGTEEIEARKFVLVDKKGKVRGSWETVDSNPTLLMWSAEEKGIAFGVTKKGEMGLWIWGEGKAQTALVTKPNGTQALAFYDRYGEVRAVLGITSKGEPVSGTVD